MNLSLQLNKAKICTFLENKILNQGQFYYWLLKPLFGEDIFDGIYHPSFWDSKRVSKIDKFLPSFIFQKILSLFWIMCQKVMTTGISSVLLNPIKCKQSQMRLHIFEKIITNENISQRRYVIPTFSLFM